MDRYKRTLNRPKSSETVTVSALAWQLYSGQLSGQLGAKKYGQLFLQGIFKLNKISLEKEEWPLA
ncbi:hypothetical protein BpHYR1_043871 [Brachionus plicatilis]|uniref:Uncharacterized protein n=1 Tax=Brachionus plicatilis TaxID=10195 RepID=A0A3M7QI07_BRAPC|nr:hypothetical protein BpHYR1_043871 [Brachionus plicatilis]